MRQLRVLMTTDAVGGVWTFATDLARHFAARGTEVHLVVLGPSPDETRRHQIAGIVGLSLIDSGAPLEWLDPDGAELAQARRILRDIDAEVRPDLVHVNSMREAAFGWSAPVLATVHSCAFSWWEACRGHKPMPDEWGNYRRLVRKGLNAAAIWTAPSAAMRDRAQQLYAPERSGQVVWNGIEAGKHNAGRARQPVVLAAGRLWDEAKNIAALQDVACDISWPVHVIGPARFSAAGASEVSFQSLVFHGELSRDDVRLRMSTAGIFAAPALYEPFGLGVLEAAAGGCALVLSDIPSFRELWDGAALFVPPRDHSALASALNQLIENSSLRQELASAASKRATRFDVASAGDIYLALARTIARRHSRQPRKLAEARA